MESVLFCTTTATGRTGMEIDGLDLDPSAVICIDLEKKTAKF